MQIIQGTTSFELSKNSAVAIGKFDGFHIGHRYLVEHIVRQRAKGLQAVVFTFDPSPLQFFSDGQPVQELMTREEKRQAFADAGVDVLVEYPLTKESASVSAEDFVGQILHRQMKAAYIAAGSDVTFGDRGLGNAELLEKLSGTFGYTLQLVEKVMDREGHVISSTYIRELVQQGKMDAASRLMGAGYLISGTVVHGRKLGRTIGMPTVNLIPPASKLMPPKGVYYSRVYFKGKTYKSITNVGCKPTVSDLQALGAESYLYDFHAEIYGEEIQVELLEFKRPEMRFDGVEALKAQMEADIAAGIMYHRTHN